MWHLRHTPTPSPNWLKVQRPFAEPLTPWDFLDQNVAVAASILQQLFVFTTVTCHPEPRVRYQVLWLCITLQLLEAKRGGKNVIIESGWGIQHWDFYWNKVCFLTPFPSAFGAPALSGFFSDIFTFSARKQNTSEHVWTALLCTCKVFTKISSSHEIWPVNEWMSRNNRNQQAHENKGTNAHKQTI